MRLSNREDKTEEWDKLLSPLGFKIVTNMCWYHPDLYQSGVNFDLSAVDNPSRIIKMIFEAGVKHGREDKMAEIKTALGIKEED